MKNFVHPGRAVVVKKSEVSAKSGDLVEIGDLFGVAITDAEIGQDLVLETEGVFYIPKVEANNIKVGDHLSVSNGTLSSDKTTGKIVAIAVETALNGQSHVMAKLLGIALPAEAGSGP